MTGDAYKRHEGGAKVKVTDGIGIRGESDERRAWEEPQEWTGRTTTSPPSK